MLSLDQRLQNLVLNEQNLLLYKIPNRLQLVVLLAYQNQNWEAAI